MTGRWFIEIEAADGATEQFGFWRDSDTPTRLAEKLRAESSYYGGDGAEYRVKVGHVQRWPGLKRMLERINS